MRSACMTHSLQLAKHPITGDLGKIVQGAIEVGVVVPSILKKRLEDAGYSVVFKTGKEHGCWVLVTKDLTTEYDDHSPNIVARAFSHDAGDALVQAIYAWMKEVQIEVLKPLTEEFKRASAAGEEKAVAAVQSKAQAMKFRFEIQQATKLQQGGVRIHSI